MIVANRALVPATGWYDWNAVGTLKQPYSVRAGDGHPQMRGALWERWLDRQRADLNRELRRIELSGDQHRIEEILNELEAIKRRRYSAAPFSAE